MEPDMRYRLVSWLAFLATFGTICPRPTSACDTPAAVAQLASDFSPVLTFDRIGYIFVDQTISTYNEGYAKCNAAVATSKSAGNVDYARLATFKKFETYMLVMSALAASPINGKQVIIGAHNNYWLGADLREWYWTWNMDDRLCYIFDDSNGQTQATWPTVPDRFILDSISGSQNDKPYVYSTFTDDPYHVVPLGNKNMNLPIICEFGCGNNNFSKTIDWTVKASTTAVSSTTSTTSLAGSFTTSRIPSTPSSKASMYGGTGSPAPTSCRAGGPAYFCNDIIYHKGVMNVVINGICYVWGSVYANNPTFDASHNLSTNLIANFNATSYIDYGRVAVFETPGAYHQVMEYFKNRTVTDNLLIGASSLPTGSGYYLNEFFWTTSTAGTSMCSIFSQDGTAPGSVPSRYSLTSPVMGGGGGPYVLMAAPTSPNQFLAVSSSNVTTGLAIFEYGCGTGAYTSTPAWLEDNATTTAPMSSSTLETSTTPTESASSISSPKSTDVSPASSTVPSTAADVASTSSPAGGNRSCSDVIQQNCDGFTDTTNSKFSMVINGICYAFMGSSNTKGSFVDASSDCSSRKVDPATPFEYGRVAVFETPSMYDKFMAMLKMKGISDYALIGVINDGRPAGPLNEYMWMFDNAESMCYVFNKDDKSSGPPSYATVKAVGTKAGAGQQKPPGGIPSAYYSLCGNASDPFNFKAFVDPYSSSPRPYICEFGCGSAPNYTATPEWYNISASLNPPTTTTTSTSTSTSTSTATTFTSTSTSVSTKALSISTSFSSTSATKLTSQRSSTAASACTEATMVSIVSDIPDPLPRSFPFVRYMTFADSSTTHIYGYVETLPPGEGPATLDKMDKYCASSCGNIDPQLYGRTAILRSTDAYNVVYNLIVGVQQEFGVIIGAASDDKTASTLNKFYWTSIDTNTPCKTSLITTQDTYNVTQQELTNVMALGIDPTKPDVQAFYSHDVTDLNGFDFVCECGCAPYVQVDSTAPGWDVVTSSTSTTTTTSSSSSTSSAIHSSTALVTKASTPPQACSSSDVYREYKENSASTPSYFSNSSIWYTYQTGSTSVTDLIGIDQKCDEYCTSHNPAFYGRSAMILSDDDYLAIFQAVSKAPAGSVVIGATGNSTAKKLCDFRWTEKGTNTGTVAIKIACHYDVIAKGTSATLVMAFDVGVQNSVCSYDLTAISGKAYLCQCECAPFQTTSSTSSSATVSASTVVSTRASSSSTASTGASSAQGTSTMKSTSTSSPSTTPSGTTSIITSTASSVRSTSIAATSSSVGSTSSSARFSSTGASTSTSTEPITTSTESSTPTSSTQMSTTQSAISSVSSTLSSVSSTGSSSTSSRALSISTTVYPTSSEPATSTSSSGIITTSAVSTSSSSSAAPSPSSTDASSASPTLSTGSSSITTSTAATSAATTSSADTSPTTAPITAAPLTTYARTSSTLSAGSISSTGLSSSIPLSSTTSTNFEASTSTEQSSSSSARASSTTTSVTPSTANNPSSSASTATSISSFRSTFPLSSPLSTSASSTTTDSTIRSTAMQPASDVPTSTSTVFSSVESSEVSTSPSPSSSADFIRSTSDQSTLVSSSATASKTRTFRKISTSPSASSPSTLTAEISTEAIGTSLSDDYDPAESTTSDEMSSSDQQPSSTTPVSTLTSSAGASTSVASDSSTAAVSTSLDSSTISTARGLDNNTEQLFLSDTATFEETHVQSRPAAAVKSSVSITVGITTIDYDQSTAAQSGSAASTQESVLYVHTSPRTTPPQDPAVLMDMNLQASDTTSTPDDSYGLTLEDGSSTTSIGQDSSTDSASSPQSTTSTAEDETSVQFASTSSFDSSTTAASSSSQTSLPISGKTSARRLQERTQGTMRPIEQLVMVMETEQTRSSSFSTSTESKETTADGSRTMQTSNTEDLMHNGNLATDSVLQTTEDNEEQLATVLVDRQEQSTAFLINSSRGMTTTSVPNPSSMDKTPQQSQLFPSFSPQDHSSSIAQVRSSSTDLPSSFALETASSQTQLASSSNSDNPTSISSSYSTATFSSASTESTVSSHSRDSTSQATSSSSSSSPLNSQTSDPPASSQSLVELVIPPFFRIPPNVHIDNSVSLLPRSKMNTSPPDPSSASQSTEISSWYPVMNDPAKQNDQSSAATSTNLQNSASTITPIITVERTKPDNAGNSNHPTPGTASDQALTDSTPSAKSNRSPTPQSVGSTSDSTSSTFLYSAKFWQGSAPQGPSGLSKRPLIVSTVNPGHGSNPSIPNSSEPSATNDEDKTLNQSQTKNLVDSGDVSIYSDSSRSINSEFNRASASDTAVSHSAVSTDPRPVTSGAMTHPDQPSPSGEPSQPRESPPNQPFGVSGSETSAQYSQETEGSPSLTGPSPKEAEDKPPKSTDQVQSGQTTGFKTPRNAESPATLASSTGDSNAENSEDGASPPENPANAEPLVPATVTGPTRFNGAPEPTSASSGTTGGTIDPFFETGLANSHGAASSAEPGVPTANHIGSNPTLIPTTVSTPTSRSSSGEVSISASSPINPTTSNSQASSFVTPLSPAPTSVTSPNETSTYDTSESHSTISPEAIDPDADDMDKDDITGPIRVDPMTKSERMAADIMHSLGCIFVVGCCGACVVLGMITNFRSPDRQMPLSQELSLMLQHLLILLWHDATTQSTLCTVVSVAIQYFTLVFFTSMLLDSVRNFLILVSFIDRPNQISSAAMQVTSWAAPGLITALSAAMYYKHYDSDFSCWINADHPVAYFTIAPVGLMSALGIIINEASGTLAPCQPTPADLKCSHSSSFVSRNGFFIILPLSIASWAIGFSAVFYQNLPVYATVSGINIALGVKMFSIHALQNDQIRAVIDRLWTRVKSVVGK